MLLRNRWFIAAALAYALLGGLLGLAWLAFPGKLPALALRAHAHLMLVGFIAMMIFGVGVHVLPRFTGRALFSERLADAQFALANLGLLWIQFGLVHASALMTVAGFLADWRGLTLAGGVAAMGAFAVFAWRLVPVLRHRGSVEGSG